MGAVVRFALCVPTNYGTHAPPYGAGAETIGGALVTNRSRSAFAASSCDLAYDIAVAGGEQAMPTFRNPVASRDANQC
jgi:hypothetical protein